MKLLAATCLPYGVGRRVFALFHEAIWGLLRAKNTPALRIASRSEAGVAGGARESALAPTYLLLRHLQRFCNSNCFSQVNIYFKSVGDFIFLPDQHIAVDQPRELNIGIAHD